MEVRPVEAVDGGIVSNENVVVALEGGPERPGAVPNAASHSDDDWVVGAPPSPND